MLEQSFRAAGREFQSVISGPLPDATVAAIHGNERALLKIHGDCGDSTFRVFTVDEYDRAYGAMGNPETSTEAQIGSLAWLLFTNRPLLFLGCSLENDRTVHVLRSIRQQLPSLTHYAVVAADRSRARWDKREQDLDKLGVRALWYAPGCYDEVEKLLSAALERASTRPLTPTRRSAPHQERAAAVSPVTMADVPALLPVDIPEPDADPHAIDLALIARALQEGRLAFFLGAYASLDPKLLANAIYDQLARKFDCPALVGDRTAAAAFIISRHGAPLLWQELRSLLEVRSSKPSALHRLIAALPAFLRETGTNCQLWILTTNFETHMEEALADAGEAFHLLYYANDCGDGEACFVERSPEGDLRRVEKPENLRHLGSSAHVVVKLNGGLAYYGDIAEQVSIERAQFERLAARIPAILPGFLRTELRVRSLLFLGHGLAVPDVEALIKFASGSDRTLRSWAVQRAPEDPESRASWQDNATHWRGWGLKILNDDLKRFTAALCRRLLERAPIA